MEESKRDTNGYKAPHFFTAVKKLVNIVHKCSKRLPHCRNVYKCSKRLPYCRNGGEETHGHGLEVFKAYKKQTIHEVFKVFEIRANRSGFYNRANRRNPKVARSVRSIEIMRTW